MTGRGASGWLRIWLLSTARFVVALAVFAAAEVFATEVLSSPDRMPLWLVLVATALVAMVFWLIHDPLSRLVDRLLLGERAGGYEAGRMLLQRMSTTLSVDEIVPALAETAGRTMRSTRAEVRLLLSDGDRWSRVWPEQAVADGSPVTVDVRHAGSAVGEIEVDLADADESDRDRALLDDLARPAGLALSTVRLTVELRRRAAELEDLNAALRRSYRRIADTRRTEIARMRTEMQYRVMPHLDRAHQAIIQELDDADRPDDADGRARPEAGRIDRARGDIAEALESLRILARGIYPPRLTDAGLAASLEGWQQRSGLAVNLEIRGDETVLRDNAELESCLYFCLVTTLGALTDGAQSPSAVLRIGPVEVSLIVSRPAGNGSVVHGPAMMTVRDRVEAFGGTFDVVVGKAQAVGGGGTYPAETADRSGARSSDAPGRVVLRARIPLLVRPDGPVADQPASRQRRAAL